MRASRRARAAAALLLLSVTLAAADKPNIVLFSVDDGLTSSAIEVAYEKLSVESGARNPNGCPPPITWFTDKRSDCGAVLEALALGHEVATHTRNHPKGGDGLSYGEWKDEVEGQQKWLEECGVPAEEIRGFRAPYYVTSPELGNVLQDLGFVWDSSLTPNSPVPAAPMNENFPFDCKWGDCEGWDQLSLWEVPAYALAGSGKRSDPEPLDGKSVLERLQEDFESKRGTGVPVSILTHEEYLWDSSNRDDVSSFFQWALGQENTYALTYSEYIAWLQAGDDTPVMDVIGNCTST